MTRFWKDGNDLYTGTEQPTESAVEITEDEYQEIFAERKITHLPQVDVEEEIIGGEDFT